jgi:hypothetical protein
VTTGAGAYIEHAAASEAEGMALQLIHFGLGAKECGHGHFVVIEQVGVYHQAVGTAAFLKKIGNGLPHRVVFRRECHKEEG